MRYRQKSKKIQVKKTRRSAKNKEMCPVDLPSCFLRSAPPWMLRESGLIGLEQVRTVIL